MLGNTRTSDTSLTSLRCPCTLHPAFCQRMSWPKRVQTVWPQWLYQPWPQLWINLWSLTGPSVWSELCAAIWTGPQTSPSRRVLTKTSHQLLSSLESSKLWSCVMSSLIKRPTLYIRSKSMSGPLLLLRPSSRESPWNRSYQPATGNHIIPSHNFIWRM